MSSFLRNLFSKVVQRGAAAAEPPPAPPPKWSQAGLPPMTKFRPPTKDGRAPQSAGDIDPKLLAELYKMGPALKTETSQPTAPPTSEERSRKARYGKLRQTEAPPEGRLVEADVIHFLDWRGSRTSPDVASFAAALGGGPGAEATARALARDFGHPQIQEDRGVRIGLWGAGSVADGVIHALPVGGEPRPAATPRPLPGRRARPPPEDS